MPFAELLAGIPLNELGLNRTSKQIYFFLWRRLGKIARTGAAAAASAAAAALDGAVLDEETLEQLPLLADVLGVTCDV